MEGRGHGAEARCGGRWRILTGTSEGGGREGERGSMRQGISAGVRVQRQRTRSRVP